MTGKQHAVMWLGLFLVITRLFTSGQWGSIWQLISSGGSGGGGGLNLHLPGPQINLPLPNPLPIGPHSFTVSKVTGGAVHNGASNSGGAVTV